MSLGLRYMVESAFYFSIMSALVKWAGETVPFEQIVLARSVVALVISYVWIRRVGLSPWGNRRRLLFLRGFFGLGGLTCFYYAVTHIPLADATVIQYTNPVFVAILAAFVLREKIGLTEVLGALAALTGVALIAQPSFLFGGEGPRLELFDVTVALGGSIAAACAYTVVRKLGETEEPIVVVFWFPLVATPLILPFALAAEYIPDWKDLLVLLAVGIATQVAQVRMTQGLQLEPAGRATAMTYLQVVFAFLWGVLLFSEYPGVMTIAGTLVVIASTYAISRLRSRSKSSVSAEDSSLQTSDEAED